MIFLYPLWGFAIKINSKDGLILANEPTDAVHKLVTNF